MMLILGGVDYMYEEKGDTAQLYIIRFIVDKSPVISKKIIAVY